MVEINKDFKNIVEILKNGTKEQREEVWKQIRAEADANPEAYKFRQNECQGCENAHKLYSCAWKISKKDNWTVDYFCETCETAWLFSFEAVKIN